MSTNIFSRQNSTGPRPTYLAINGRPDATGAWHTYCTDTDEIVVTKGAQIQHREKLGTRTVAEWKAYVAAERGWADAEESLTAALLEADR
jgi:hypothetical protein